MSLGAGPAWQELGDLASLFFLETQSYCAVPVGLELILYRKLGFNYSLAFASQLLGFLPRPADGIISLTEKNS